MKNDKELDQLLESLTKRDTLSQPYKSQIKTDNIINEEGSLNRDLPLAPPAPKASQGDFVWLSSDDSITPPAPSVHQPEQKEDEDNNQNAPKQKKINIKKPDFKNINLKSKLKITVDGKLSKKGFGILVGVTVGIMLIVAAIVIANIYFDNKEKANSTVVEKYSYKQDMLSAYSKPYKDNNNIAGWIYFEDLDQESYVTLTNDEKYATFATNTDITVKNQILAVDVTNMNVDLEKLYATSGAYTNSSQTVEFDTLFEQGTYQVAAAYYTNTLPEDNNGYVFPYNISGTITQKSFLTFRGKIESRAIYDTSINLLSNQQTLTISADSNTLGENYKFVVVCVKTDEVKKVKSVTDNPSPYYPQAYYDLQGVENPYQYALGWYPQLVTNQATGAFKQTDSRDFE